MRLYASKLNLFYIAYAKGVIGGADSSLQRSTRDSRVKRVALQSLSNACWAGQISMAIHCNWLQLVELSQSSSCSSVRCLNSKIRAIDIRLFCYPQLVATLSNRANYYLEEFESQCRIEIFTYTHQMLLWFPSTLPVKLLRLCQPAWRSHATSERLTNGKWTFSKAYTLPLDWFTGTEISVSVRQLDSISHIR